MNSSNNTSQFFDFVPIEECLAELEDGRKIHQGWSPQCEKAPADDSEWGVLKTTSIQPARFQPNHNKRLPTKLSPRPHLEVKSGDILLTCAGPRHRCGVSCLVRNTRKRLMISGKMYRFRANPARIRPDYLEVFLQTDAARQAIDRMKTGISDSGLNLTHDRFRQLVVPITSTDQQERIVAEIEKQFTRLDAGVASLKRVQTALKRYRASVLRTACEGDWPRIRVDDVAIDVRYGTSAKTNDKSDDVPVLRMGNISEGRLVLDKLKFLPKSHAEFPELFLKPGDLLFNRTNSAELVGKTAVYRGTPEPCSFASYLIRVRLADAYSSDFLSYYLNSVYGRQWIASVVSQQVGQANVNGTKLKALEVPIPPFDEQKRIIADVERRLSVIEEVESITAAELQRATRLRQSILGASFSTKSRALGRLVLS